MKTKIEIVKFDFTFRSGAWVSLEFDGGVNSASWEFQADKDDDDTYLSGCLWFDDGVLVDYDGCFELPNEIGFSLKKLGFKLNI